MHVQRIRDAFRFAAEKMTKSSLFETSRLWLDVYGLEPGQAQKIHAHDGWIRGVAVSRDGEHVATCGNDKLVKSIKNLEAHQFLPPEGVNVYDLLRHDHLVVSKEAAKALEARCLR